MKTGRPSTAPELTAEFLRTAFDPGTGELTVPRRGRIWEAIRTAHATGSRGSGRCIAIVDIEFDPALIPDDRVHAASVIPPYQPGPERGRHGTTVARLVLAVAPEAEVLLLDAARGDEFGEAETAAAVTAAVEAGAHAINISAEFATDCEVRSLSGIDGALLDEVDPDPERFLAQVELWLERREPYAGPRCPGPCRICGAVTSAISTTAVFAASGNDYPAACPACVSGVVGAGFQRSESLEIDGDVVTQYVPGRTRHGHLLRPDLMLEEPDGFLGTSFASPLLAGLAALLPEPDLAEMAGLPWAATPVLTLANLHRETEPDAVPPRAIETLLAGMQAFADAIPARHQHWKRDAVRAPCAICALLLADWYDTLVSIQLMRGAVDDALWLGDTAAIIAPFSPGSASNAGLAWEMSSRRLSRTERSEALRWALHEFERAVELAPEVGKYTEHRDRLRAAGA